MITQLIIMKNTLNLIDYLIDTEVTALDIFEQEEIIKLATKIIINQSNHWHKIKDTEEIKAHLRIIFANQVDEAFYVLFLNNDKNILSQEKLFTGTVNECVIYPRVIIRKALELNASWIIIAHNHPWGSKSPSKTDKDTTTKLKKALSMVDLELIDHLVVWNTGVMSFSELGWLRWI